MSEYTEIFIDRVWNKATVIEGFDSSRWRQDFAGAWIQKDQYGIQSTYGWEIDHLVPRSHGGSDEIGNLVPLHWKNNETKGADTPVFKTSVSSSGNKNIERIRQWRI